MIRRLIVLPLLVASTIASHAAGLDSTARTPDPDTVLPAGIFPNTWEVVYGMDSSVHDVGLLGVVEDTLMFTASAPTTIRLSNVQLMRRRNGGHFWRGAAWGAGISAPLGIAAIAWAGTEPAQVRGGQMLLAAGMWAGCALFGGIVGALFPRTEEVELAVLPVDERRETLRLIAAQDSTARIDALEAEHDRARRRAIKAAWRKGGGTATR